MVGGMMRSPVQNINPAVLKWARERKHYAPADIVEKLGAKSVTQEVFVDWEKGKGAPTYPQLEKLADCYKVPIAVFFFPELPEIEDAAASLRSVPGFNLDSLQVATLNVIHRVQATQMTLKELNEGVNPVSDPLHKSVNLGANGDFVSREKLESLATQLRGEDLLSVSMEDQQNWSDPREALWAWRDAVERQGIFVFRWPFKSDDMSGFCLYDEEFPVVCLDSQESYGRQIFTLMHELAHLLYGESSVTLAKDGLEVAEDRETERYFDHIAGAVLVPMADLREQISKSNVRNEDFYDQQAKRYKVSRSMLLVRCVATGLIRPGIFKDMQEEFLSEYGSGARSDAGGDYYWNQLSYWGKAFLQNILQARYQDKISDYDMAEILDMKIKNVEKLEGYLINKQLSFGTNEICFRH